MRKHFEVKKVKIDKAEACKEIINAFYSYLVLLWDLKRYPDKRKEIKKITRIGVLLLETRITRKRKKKKIKK